jgi:hypothetical protein
MLAGLGRWIGRVVLPVVAVLGGLWLLANGMVPQEAKDVLMLIAALGVMLYGMQMIVTAPFRAAKKQRKKRR